MQLKRPVRLAVPLIATATVLTAVGCSAGVAKQHAIASSTSPTTPPSPAPTTSGAPTTPQAPTATELMNQMKTGMAAATSVRVKGSITDGGTKITIDLAVNAAGNGFGTVSSGTGSSTVLRADGKTYFQLTDALMKAENVPADDADAVRGKYLMMSDSQALPFSQLFNPKAFIAGADGSGAPDATVDGTTRINGQAAYVLKGSDGSTLYLAAQGGTLPLRITRSTDQLDFTGWNADLKIPAAPSGDQVIDAGKLTSS